MSKRKYRPRTATAAKVEEAPMGPPHKPMSDKGMLVHLQVIKVAMTFPDTVMTVPQIKDLVAMDTGSERDPYINQSVFHLAKVTVRENGEPVSGHPSRLDGYEEFKDFMAAGVFYRTTTGSFVLDTQASWQGEWHRNNRGLMQRRLRLVGNQWPFLPYKAMKRVIPASKVTSPKLPAPEKVVEEVLNEIDSPINDTATKVAEQVEIIVGDRPPFVGTDGLPESADEFTPSNNGMKPEPEPIHESEAAFEVLSVPSDLHIGAEMVMRVGGEIVIASINKRYPLSGSR